MHRNMLFISLLGLLVVYIGCSSSDNNSGGSGGNPTYFYIYSAETGQRIPDGNGQFINWQSVVECVDAAYMPDGSGYTKSPACTVEMSAAASCYNGGSPTNVYYLTSDIANGATFTCSREAGNPQKGTRTFQFPVGNFTIKEQVWVPPSTTLVGNKAIVSNPNDPEQLIDPINETEHTLFVADTGYPFYSSDFTKYYAPIGQSDINAPYCDFFQDPNSGAGVPYRLGAKYARIGFLMHSNTQARNFVFQGGDTFRPTENNYLCGGGAFETPGCISAYGGSVGSPNCFPILVPSSDPGFQQPLGSDWVTGGYAQIGAGGNTIQNVVIENIRVNDPRLTNPTGTIASEVIAAPIQTKRSWGASQVTVYAAPTPDGSQVTDLQIKDVAAITTVADGMNLRYVANANVSNVLFANPGDDGVGFWGDNHDSSATFEKVEVIYPGVRNHTEAYSYGSCIGIYGAGDPLSSSTFTIQGLTCKGRVCPGARASAPCEEMAGAHAVVMYNSDWFYGFYRQPEISLSGIDWLESDGGNDWTPVTPQSAAGQHQDTCYSAPGPNPRAPFNSPDQSCLTAGP